MNHKLLLSIHIIVDTFRYERRLTLPDNPQQPFYQHWVFILFVLFLGIAFVVVMVNQQENSQTVQAAVPASPFYKKLEKEELKEKMAQPNKTPEVAAAENVMKNFGTTNIEKENAVLSSRFESGVVETITLVENFKSPESLQRSLLYKVGDFMKAMKSEEEVTQATLIVQAPLSDRYGNVENGDVMVVILSKETLNKINFNHFNAKNLPFVADSFWEHPALSAAK